MLTESHQMICSLKMVGLIIFRILITNNLKLLASLYIVNTCKIYFVQVCQVMLSDQTKQT